MRRHRALFASVAVVLAAIGALTYAVVRNPFDPFDDRPFSPERWRNSDAESRAHMGRSAVEYAKPGMSESEIEAAFGKPDEIDLDKEDAGGHKLTGVKTWEWGLGNWSVYGYDDAFLYISFDSSGKVVSAQVNGY